MTAPFVRGAAWTSSNLVLFHECFWIHRKRAQLGKHFSHKRVGAQSAPGTRTMCAYAVFILFNFMHFWSLWEMGYWAKQTFGLFQYNWSYTEKKTATTKGVEPQATVPEICLTVPLLSTVPVKTWCCFMFLRFYYFTDNFMAWWEWCDSCTS